MSAQRKLKKLRPANDAAVKNGRTLAVHYAHRGISWKKLICAAIVIVFLGLMAFGFWPTTETAQHQTSATRPTIAVYPTATKRDELPAPTPAKNALPDLQVAASTFQTLGHKDDSSAINIVAEKISDLPVIEGKHIESGADYVNSDDSEGQLIRAHHLLEQESWVEAAQMYDDVLSYEPRNHAALSGKLYAAAKDNNIDQAISAGLALHKYYPNDTASSANLARVYAHDGDFEHAIRYMEIAARQSHGYLPYSLNLATYYDHAGDQAQALKLYEQVAMAAERNETLSSVMPGILVRIRYLDDKLSSSDGDDTGGDPPTTSPDEMR